MKKINFKKAFIYVLTTFLIGNIFSLFINSKDYYTKLNKEPNVPSIVFPIVWTILYLIMSISVYIISQSVDIDKKKAIKIYYLQLIINSLWTLIFFEFHLYILSFIWIILIIVLSLIMIIKFYKINKVAGIINIPYLLWLLFALYLNFSIIILNT